MLRVWIHGVCDPNPGGTAAYSVVVKQNLIPLFKKSGVVGAGRGMTSNVAEYSALIALIEWLEANLIHVPKGREMIRVYSDSELLVNQMNGLWGVHGGAYLKYYEQASMRLSEVKVEGVPLFNKLKFEYVEPEESTIKEIEW